MPSLTYGSKVTNAYIQIAQILRRATARPPPLPPRDPNAETTGAPEQRVPTAPAPEPRVVPVRATPQPPVQPTQPMPSQAPMMTPPSQTYAKPTKQPQAEIRKPPRLPRLQAQRRYVTRYGRAIDGIQLAQHAEAYTHHIAAMATPIDTTKGSQGSIRKLLKGPDKLI